MRTGAMLAMALVLFLTGAAGWPVSHAGEAFASVARTRFSDKQGLCISNRHMGSARAGPSGS